MDISKDLPAILAAVVPTRQGGASHGLPWAWGALGGAQGDPNKTQVGVPGGAPGALWGPMGPYVVPLRGAVFRTMYDDNIG